MSSKGPVSVNILARELCTGIPCVRCGTLPVWFYEKVESEWYNDTFRAVPLYSSQHVMRTYHRIANTLPLCSACVSDRSTLARTDLLLVTPAQLDDVIVRVYGKPIRFGDYRKLHYPES